MLLFSAGKEVSETVFFAQHPPPTTAVPTTTPGAAELTALGAHTSDNLLKEDELQGPETTSTGDLLNAATLVATTTSDTSVLPVIAKVDRGFDLDATRKFARMLRKEEKVKLC